MNILTIDNIDALNQLLGIETLHPLVTVYNMKDTPRGAELLIDSTNRYEVYALLTSSMRHPN